MPMWFYSEKISVAAQYKTFVNSSASQSSFSWNGVSLGGPGYVVIAVTWAQFSVSLSTSIDGVSGTLLGSVAVSGSNQAALYAANVSHSSGTISLTFSGTVHGGVAVGVYFMSGMTRINVTQSYTSAAVSPTATMNVPENSAILVAAQVYGAPSYTNATMDFSTVLSGSNYGSSAHNNLAAANPSLTITCNGSSFTRAGSFISLSP